jgi:hypothetical protein
MSLGVHQEKPLTPTGIHRIAKWFDIVAESIARFDTPEVTWELLEYFATSSCEPDIIAAMDKHSLETRHHINILRTQEQHTMAESATKQIVTNQYIRQRNKELNRLIMIMLSEKKYFEMSKVKARFEETTKL